jgi:lysylphosphatidylglycerol synthase-like protein
MSRTIRLALLVAGLALVTLLIIRAGPALVVDMLTRVGWSFAVVVAVNVAHLILRSVALWRSVVGRPVRFVDVLRIRFSSEAVEVLTSTGPFLAEPAKGWWLIRRGLPAADAFAAVAIEYLLYTTVAACLALVAFWLLLVRGVVPTLLQPVIFALAGLAASIVAGVVFAAISGIGLIAPAVRATGAIVGRSRSAFAADRVTQVEQILVSFLHRHPGRLAEVLAVDAASHAFLLSEVWIVLAALGLPFLLVDPLMIEGAVKPIGMVFFFIPGQVGASEGVYVALFRAAGLPAAAGLTLVLMRRMRSLLVAGTALLVLTWLDDR